MSSVSGDENTEVMENEPVRRTRSGRAVKSVGAAATPKKTPVRKVVRSTRARIAQEIEEESTPLDNIPENGVQQDISKNEEDTSNNQIHLTQNNDENQEQMCVMQMNENQEENYIIEQEQINQYQQDDNVQQESEYQQEQENEYQQQQEEIQQEQVDDFQQEQETEFQEEQETAFQQEQQSEYQQEQETEFQPEQEVEFQQNSEFQQGPENEYQQEQNDERQMTKEGDPIPEFDPEEKSQEETSGPEPMSVDQAPPVIESTLRVKPASEMMEETVDDQCILIEDDTDQQFVLEEEEAKNTDSAEKEATNKKYSSQDSEIIPDIDQFRNEDVEFISDGNDIAENFVQQNPDDAHEVIEISDHESEPATKKNEIDTEAVSEDELPTETATKYLNACEDVEEVSDEEFFSSAIKIQEPETEAVSDEELPVAQPADLGETESVSDDELPVESEKKRKGSKVTSKTTDRKSKSDVSSKRKRNAEGEYDPSSPTSENNDETPAKKVAVSADVSSSDKTDAKPPSPKKKVLPELEKYWKAVNDDPSDFTGWTYLLQYVDQENDAEAAREAYNKFLERYPYCYGYWRKYADYEKKKGDPERVQTVFDQGLKAISLSVDLWLHYINHCKVAFEKDEEKLREQFERAIKACGLEFRSDRLWESYIKWESDNKRLSKVMAIYDRLLVTPTQGYMSHFESFQDFVTTNSPNRFLNVDDFLAIRAEVKNSLKTDDSAAGSDDAPPGEESPTNDTPPTDEETRAIREKIISSRRKMHKSNVNAVAARWTFEEGIKRPYFHVKPLERCQLKNWKEYLDYEIEQKDQNRIIILFERCLIACALYDEFWMRFIRYLESLKGDNTDKIRDVYTRACTVHHPKKPNLHLQWATFEESLGNFDKAASILENIDNVIPNMLQIAYRRINLERRRNDLDKACTLYEYYINNSKNRTIANNIVVKYARFLCKIKNDTDKAIKVLLKATEKDKDNPRLYLQLIDLGLQRNPINSQEVVGYMDLFIDREHADAEQRVLFAQRKVEFLEDFSTDIREVLKAHEQFQKCIKQAKERKKTKSDESKTDATAAKKVKTDTTSVPAPQVGSQSYQYSSSTTPYQSQQQFQSGQYGSQSGYQQGYQQYPPPSDPNYANYQNWQYSQSGPQPYAYNQWGSYNYY